MSLLFKGIFIQPQKVQPNPGHKGGAGSETHKSRSATKGAQPVIPHEAVVSTTTSVFAGAAATSAQPVQPSV